MYCSNCGAAQPDRTRFCTRCGAQVADAGRDEPSPRQAPAYGAPDRYPPPGGSPYEPAGGYPPPYPGPPPADPRYARPPQPADPRYAPRPRRRLRGTVAAAAAVVVVLGGLAVAGWREHWPAAVFGKAAPQALAWSAAQAPLPADAAQTSSQNAALFDVACPSVQNCVAVGDYIPSDSGGTDGSSKALAETLSDGTWTPTAVPVNLPDPSQVTYLNLDGVACPAAGACVAIGFYDDNQGIEKPVTATLSGGTWTSAIPPLPGNANQKSALLSQVACPARGTCVATGWYTDQNGDTQGLIETLTGGTWTADQAPLPAGAVPQKASSSELATGLYEVKCPAVGNCVAAGNYTGQNGSSQGLIDTLSDGTWTATRAPLPADAAANPVVYLLGIACPAPGTCLAGGRYTGQDGRGRDLAETLSGGIWTPAAVPVPADAAANQKWSITQITGITAVACEVAGSCVAAGSYSLANGTVQGVIDTLSGGTWMAARALLPAGAAVAKQYVFFDSAVCPAAGHCLAVGGYIVQNGSTQALIETADPKAGPG